MFDYIMFEVVVVVWGMLHHQKLIVSLGSVGLDDLDLGLCLDLVLNRRDDRLSCPPPILLLFKVMIL